MKQLFTLILIGFSSFATAQIINIPDANFKEALVNSLCVDTDGDWQLDNDADSNDDGEIQVTEALALTWLVVINHPITSLSGIENFINLQSLFCYNNQLTSLNVQGLTNLEILNCRNNQLTSIDMQGLTNLHSFDCRDNQLTSINVQGLYNLEDFFCHNNQLTSVDVQGLTNLQDLNCAGNQLTSLDIQDLTKLKGLSCSDNQITSLDLQKLVNIQQLTCHKNQLTSLDVQALVNMIYLRCDSNQLLYLNLKTGNLAEMGVVFRDNPNLFYICCDNDQVTRIQNSATQAGLTYCSVNSYCSFTPGGIFYTLQGESKIDINNNGCDAGDIFPPYSKFIISNTATTGEFISDNSGNYVILVGEGTHTLTPVIEISDYYSISPVTNQVTVPEMGDTVTQNFCFAPNGVHHDVEISIIPITNVRPGFNATYKVIYKNKGTQLENGTVNLTFDDNHLDLISTSQNYENQNAGTLTWSYSDLLPFETRAITLILYCNSPTDALEVNIGDTLNFNATIQIAQSDEIQIDNDFELDQIVSGSLDPNGKSCLEGSRIIPEKVGDYLHYLIRFENIGTSPATHIVVKDIIDTSVFNINALQPTHASHDYYTRISNSNVVEFFFENIQLPFTEPDKHGYIAFKIKTKSDLIIGDSLKNQAAIFFDYNLPVITNEAQTTVQEAVSIFDIPNRDVSQMPVFPNPVHDILHFQTTEIVKKIEVFDMLGRIRLSQEVAFNQASMETLTSGGYMLKIYVSDRVYYAKVVKE